MIINTQANLVGDAYVRRINELRNDLEAQYSAMPSGVTHAEVAEWMLSDDVDTKYDLDDAVTLRRIAGNYAD